MSYVWAKLWLDILDNSDVALLDDHLWRRYIELILLAKGNNQGGVLPPLRELAFRLRSTEEAVNAELKALEDARLLVFTEDFKLAVRNFEKRQAALDHATRQREYRERVTKRHLSGDNDRDKKARRQQKQKQTTEAEAEVDSTTSDFAESLELITTETTASNTERLLRELGMRGEPLKFCLNQPEVNFGEIQNLIAYSLQAKPPIENKAGYVYTVVKERNNNP